MIKKLALLLCLGMAVQAPLSAASEDSKRSKQVRKALIIGGFGLGVVGFGCLVAAYPKFFGEFFGAILRNMADSRYCSYCDRWYHKHNHHCHGHCHHHHCHGGVTVTIH